MKALLNLVNYFFSGWIANLGVEPLFLSAAFLLAPALRAFLFLLVSVTCVLEAILLSLSKLKNQWIFLTISGASVKVFLATLVILTGSSWTSSASAKSLFLAKGEQETINISDLANFSIGNPEVISVKYQPEIQRLLIKAKSVGYSDLILWSKGKEKVKYEVYSSTKTQQVTKLRLIKSLNASGLETIMTPNKVVVTGRVHNYLQYNLLKTIWGKKQWQLQTHLSLEFQMEMIGSVYRQLLEFGATYVNCHLLDMLLLCKYKGEVFKAPINQLKQKYLLTFEQLKDIDNFQLKYQIIQISESSADQRKLGIDQISLKLHRVLNSSIADLDQFLQLNAHELNAKVVASPMIVTGLNVKNSLELGSTIPFQDQTQFGTTTKWKFAGLKVDNMIRKQQERLLLEYRTELSHPTGNAISGSKANGSIFLDEDHFVKAFEITYENNDHLKNYVPIAGEIPILENFFSSKSESKGLKHIIGFIKITRKD